MKIILILLVMYNLELDVICKSGSLYLISILIYNLVKKR